MYSKVLDNTIAYTNSNTIIGNGLKLAFSKTVTGIASATWTNILSRTELAHGYYLFRIQVSDSWKWWVESLVFPLFWFSAAETNSTESSTIYFNQSGHALNAATAQLAFQRTPNGTQSYLKLYLSSCSNATATIYAYKIA